MPRLRSRVRDSSPAPGSKREALIQSGFPFLLTGRHKGRSAGLPTCRYNARQHPVAGWQSGHAAACKAVYAGSIPTPASTKRTINVPSFCRRTIYLLGHPSYKLARCSVSCHQCLGPNVDLDQKMGPASFASLRSQSHCGTLATSHSRWQSCMPARHLESRRSTTWLLPFSVHAVRFADMRQGDAPPHDAKHPAGVEDDERQEEDGHDQHEP